MTKSRLKKTEATSVTTSATLKTPKAKSSKKPLSAKLPYPEDASKQDRMIALLKRDDGATIDELIGATNWQKHSVRGFLSATVRKKLSLPLMTELRTTGERVYRIADAVNA